MKITVKEKNQNKALYIIIVYNTVFYINLTVVLIIGHDQIHLWSYVYLILLFKFHFKDTYIYL